MPAYSERKPRKFQEIIEKEKIEHLLKKFALRKTFLLKGQYNPIPVKIEDYIAPNQLVVSTDGFDLEQEDIITIYFIFNTYMELICTFDKTHGIDSFVLTVNGVRIASEKRAHDRIMVNDDQVVINNIRAAKNVIQASLFNIPTSVKVHFSQQKQIMASMADEVNVDVFDKKDDKLELVRKTGKILHIPDTQDIVSYMPEDTEAFIDYRQFLNTDIDSVMKEYKTKKIVSELIVPVTYVGHDGKAIPLGFIHLISKSDPIQIDQALMLKAQAFEMVDRIRESNTMLINKRQSIENISHGGLKLRISDEELKQFLIHQKGFSFDVIFRLQQPITVFTDIIYTGSTPENDLMIGVKIIGRSSRKGEIDRYYELIDALPRPEQ